MYLLLIGLAVLMPLYAVMNEGDFKSFFRFLVVILLAKGMNLLIRWYVQLYREVTVHKVDSAIRFFINFVLLFLLFSNANAFLVIVPMILLVALIVYFRNQTRNKGIKWEFLIEQDERRMTAFYRLANLFTDVPKLKNKIKRREWLDGLLAGISYHHDQTYSYLLGRTFLRSGDYLGLLVRLTIIGGVAIYYLTFGIGQIVLVVLFLYLTGFQLLPLWKHHQNHSMLELYPVNQKIKESSFLRILRKILALQTLLLSVVILIKGDLLAAVISLLAGIAFCIYFVYFYSKRKIKER